MLKVSELPVSWQAGRPIVVASVNGHDLRVLLDTGVKRSFLLRAAARETDVPVVDQTYDFGGLGGRIAPQIAHLGEMKIGGLTLHGDVLVADRFPLLRDTEATMIVGEDLLSRTDIEFDLTHGRIAFLMPKDCGDATLVDWAGKGAVLAMQPINPRSPEIQLVATVNGKEVQAVLDSGTIVSALTETAARRVGVDGDKQGPEIAGVGPRLVSTSLAEPARLGLSHDLVDSLPLAVGNLFRGATQAAVGSRFADDGIATELLLGIDFLRTHRVLVAHSQGRIYVAQGIDPESAALDGAEKTASR